MADAEKRLRDLIDKIAAEQGFKDYNVAIKPISSGGANFSSVLYLITVSGDRDDLKLFAKVANLGEKIRDSTPMRMFDTERFFYTRLVQIYKEIEDRHNVPEEHLLNLPKYYGNDSTFLRETIVLEDLVNEGYRDYDRLKSMDWAYASKAVEDIAKLHAISHALAKENREVFDETLKLLQINFDLAHDIQNTMLEKTANSAISVAKDEHKEKITNFISKIDPSDFKLYFTALHNPVLVHGDYRLSNQMYKIDKDGSINIKTIDFQTMQGGSPVVDLLYLIFTGTDEEFRREHYQALIDHYYEQLCAALKRLDIEPDDVYTREQYDEELREKLRFGLNISIFLLPLITVEAQNAPVLDEHADVTNFSVTKVSEVYPERMRGIINDYVRWGVL